MYIAEFECPPIYLRSELLACNLSDKRTHVALLLRLCGEQRRSLIDSLRAAQTLGVEFVTMCASLIALTCMEKFVFLHLVARVGVCFDGLNAQLAALRRGSPGPGVRVVTAIKVSARANLPRARKERREWSQVQADRSGLWQPRACY